MTGIETTIDAVRVTVASPERTVILKQKGEECYLPIWVSRTQADILATQLEGRSDKSRVTEFFLANLNVANSDVKYVTIHLENHTFYAMLHLSRYGEPCEVKCPIGIALSLAHMNEISILVDETTWETAIKIALR